MDRLTSTSKPNAVSPIHYEILSVTLWRMGGCTYIPFGVGCEVGQQPARNDRIVR